MKISETLLKSKEFLEDDSFNLFCNLEKENHVHAGHGDLKEKSQAPLIDLTKETNKQSLKRENFILPQAVCLFFGILKTLYFRNF